MKGNKVRQSEVDLKPEEGYGTSSLYCHKGVENIGSISDEDTIISCIIRGGIRTHVSKSNITLATSIEAIQSSNDQLKSRVKDSTNELKHLLCWACKENIGNTDCAFCDQPVNGRAYGMEAYLRTICG